MVFVVVSTGVLLFVCVVFVAVSMVVVFVVVSFPLAGSATTQHMRLTTHYPGTET